MAIGIAKAFDVNISRAFHDRTPENQPFVYVDDFNKCIRMSFVRD